MDFMFDKIRKNIDEDFKYWVFGIMYIKLFFCFSLFLFVIVGGGDGVMCVCVCVCIINWIG